MSNLMMLAFDRSLYGLRKEFAMRGSGYMHSIYFTVYCVVYLQTIRTSVCRKPSNIFDFSLWTVILPTACTWVHLTPLSGACKSVVVETFKFFSVNLIFY
ncbi:hypothetical protein FHG87_001735 [Trinorchestia longiramus]|nr:hypothetical protein FHG87_001735 [Trinorchestia longiramus]